MRRLLKKRAMGAAAGLLCFIAGVIVPVVVYANANMSSVPTLRATGPAQDDLDYREWQLKVEREAASRGVVLADLEKRQMASELAKEATMAALGDMARRLDKLEWLSYAVLVFIAPIGGAFATHWGKTLLRVFSVAAPESPSAAEK